MAFKNIKIQPFGNCKKYNIPLYQCPHFIFLVMGCFIIVIILISYLLALWKISDPFLVALIVLGVAAFLMVLNYIITNSFERMAEALRMKNEFIYILSHQLRGPLTNIKFALDFLFSNNNTKNTNNAQQEDYYEIIQENTVRMNDLINRLLTVAKIDSGSFSLTKTEVDLEAIAQKVFKKIKPLLEASNIKAMFFCAHKPLNVLTDPLWIEDVIENLLDNAVKYTRGGGEIKVKIYPKNNKVFLEVHDSGVGIPKEDQKFIFSKFFRSSNVLQKQTLGTGLGLYIAKKVIELSGGKIGFSSQENKGSIFWFSLPTT